MKRPIFVLGSHKSGTTLLRSLLDGAPELFVLPCEGHFFQFGGYWVDYALRRSLPDKLDFEQLVENFTKHVEASNERTSLTSPVDLVGKWDTPRFVNYLRTYGHARYDEQGYRGFLDTYIEAIHTSLEGSKPLPARFVEKSVENAEFATLLRKLYPDSKFVHIIRNPYATLVALRKHQSGRQYPFLAGAIDSLNNSYYYLYKNQELLSDYMVIRYEELVTRTEEMMRRVAEFVEVEFAQALVRPTVMGLPWPGNSSSDERFDGVSSEPLTRWRREIEPLEIEFVNLLFSHILDDYGYQPLEAGGSPYFPCPRERMKTYVANRFLWQLKKRSDQRIS